MKKPFTLIIVLIVSAVYAWGQDCKADFSIHVQESYPPVYVFIPLIPDSFASYIWEFGDGEYSYDITPSHSYQISGTYYVKLFYTSVDSCTAFYSDTITVTGTELNCKASWEAWQMPWNDTIFNPQTDSMNFTGFRYQFEDKSLGGNIHKWLWDFGDGTYSDEQNPAHTYTVPGNYNVCLEITSDSCLNSYCNSIYVEGPVSCTHTGTVKDFTGLDGCGLMIVLDDSTILEPVQIRVRDFYLYDGQRVRLSYTLLKDRMGICMMGEMARIDCIQEIYKDTCSAAFNSFPIPWVSSYPPIYQFEPVGGNVIESIWDFGDGTATNEYAPRHRYNVSGNYNVCHTIFTWDGCQVTNCVTSYFEGNYAEPDLCHTYIKLNTEIILNGMICNGSATVSLVDAEGNPQKAFNYWWSTGESGPVIDNLCPGTNYSVIVIDSLGCALSGSFAYGGGSSYPDTIIGYWNYQQNEMDFLFNIPVYSEHVNCKWYFGDGQYAEGSSVSHRYDTTRQYTVILEVSDIDGKVLLNQSILVSPGEPLAVGNFEQESLQVYPVPTQDKLFITLPGDATQLENIAIFDAGGQLLMNTIHENSNNNTVELNVADFSSGMYVGKITYKGGKNQTFRFTK